LGARASRSGHGQRKHADVSGDEQRRGVDRRPDLLVRPLLHERDLTEPVAIAESDAVTIADRKPVAESVALAERIRLGESVAVADADAHGKPIAVTIADGEPVACAHRAVYADPGALRRFPRLDHDDDLHVDRRQPGSRGLPWLHPLVDVGLE
jgi:hypothetical protein